MLEPLKVIFDKNSANCENLARSLVDIIHDGVWQNSIGIRSIEFYANLHIILVDYYLRNYSNNKNHQDLVKFIISMRIYLKLSCDLNEIFLNTFLEFFINV